MLRYVVQYVESPVINRSTPHYVVRDEIEQSDICTCRNEKDAKSIALAMNFYCDWILVKTESSVERTIDRGDPNA